MLNHRFEKRQRLRRTLDIERVFARRCSVSDGALVVYVVENGLDWSRLAMSVSRRIGIAVRRNFVRRRIREAFRTSTAQLPTGLDIMCVARGRASEPAFDAARSLQALVVKAKRRLAQIRPTEGAPGPTSRP